MKTEKNCSTEIKNIIKLVNNSDISSIKQVVTQILKVINDPDSSANDLKNIIEIDPPLTAKLLHRANSAYYGYPRSISEIQEAIVCIGFDAVRELALNQKVCELFQNDESNYGYSRSFLWKHCVAVALCSKLLFRRAFRRKGDNIYVAGLLHDIGIIVLDQFFHERFINILGESFSGKNNLINIEISGFGFNHADVAGALTEDWGFPDKIVSAIKNHHFPDKSEKNHELISGTLFVANFLVQSKLMGFCDMPYGNKTLFQKCLLKLNLKEKGTELIIGEVEKEITIMEKSGWL